MPIFGNPHSFAAEYHLEDDSMGVWMLDGSVTGVTANS